MHVLHWVEGTWHCLGDVDSWTQTCGMLLQVEGTCNHIKAWPLKVFSYSNAIFFKIFFTPISFSSSFWSHEKGERYFKWVSFIFIINLQLQINYSMVIWLFKINCDSENCRRWTHGRLFKQLDGDLPPPPPPPKKKKTRWCPIPIGWLPWEVPALTIQWIPLLQFFQDLYSVDEFKVFVLCWIPYLEMKASNIFILLMSCNLQSIRFMLNTLSRNEGFFFILFW